MLQSVLYVDFQHIMCCEVIFCYFTKLTKGTARKCKMKKLEHSFGILKALLSDTRQSMKRLITTETGTEIYSQMRLHIIGPTDALFIVSLVTASGYIFQFTFRL